MSRVIAVTSGKGGTGKTTTVAAVASCLAALEYRTLCIDFDLDFRNLDLALCMTDYTIADFMDVVKGHVKLMDACREHPQLKNLFFLRAPSSLNNNETNFKALDFMFDEIRKNFDYCVIDTPAGIGGGVRLAHTYADMSIIVATGDVYSIRDAGRAALAAGVFGIKDMRLLINRSIRRNLKWMNLTIDDVIDSIGVRLIGVIPEDKAIFRALHDGIPLIQYAKRHSIYAFLDVARRISGDEVPLRLR